jgi:hypothetical protein
MSEDVGGGGGWIQVGGEKKDDGCLYYSFMSFFIFFVLFILFPLFFFLLKLLEFILSNRYFIYLTFIYST